MTAAPLTSLATWTDTQEEEDAMNDDHAPLWNRLLDLSVEGSFADKTVLDYGCNQGGFLKLLHQRACFKEACGVDLAADSLAVAAQRLKGLNTTFGQPDILKDKPDTFDVAYSHEVLYLLPDLAAHAELIRHTLKTGGVYYAAIGCHTDQPLWDDWHKLISSYSNVPVQNYSLDDYANAFFDAGFEPTVQPYRFEGFIPLKQNNPYFPKVTDSIRYYDNDKVLFRFKKKA